MDEMERYDRSLIEPTWFTRPDDVTAPRDHGARRALHGVYHTWRVWTHAMELAQVLDFAPWQSEALQLAALWHDIGRTHDGTDYYHGAKSAGKAIGLALHRGVDELVLETSLFAVTHHSGSEEHAERSRSWLPDPDGGWDVFRALKDADALDRVRLGDLDPRYLRFRESHARIGVARQMWEATR